MVSQLQGALQEIITVFDEKSYVHSDFWSNNIMIWSDVMDKSVGLKLINFDWARIAGQVHYPAEWNREIQWPGEVSQTSFSHISINSLTIHTVLMAPKSPWKDLSIDTSHVSKQSIMAKILGRSTGNIRATGAQDSRRILSNITDCGYDTTHL